MKKRYSILCLLLVVFALSACGTKNNNNGTGFTEPTAMPSEGAPADTGAPVPGNDQGQGGYALALITDVGTIDDKSFNQGAWEGLKQYAEENNIAYKYYQPSEKSTSSYMASIDLAISAGARLVVCPGFLFEPAVYEAQSKYPDVQFILLDGTPHDEGYTDFRIDQNVYSVFYAEEQAGFLAGYAVVKDGYTKLGFMGGMAVPAVIRYGYGFVQGAEYAAKEMGIAKIDIKYHYTGGFEATPEVQAMAASWYQSGTEVIFACGGAVGNSVMTAAEASNAKVVGVDVDQSPESATVITSALKELSKSVYEGVKDFYGAKFPGGQSITLDIKKQGVALPMETSKFQKFTKEDYQAIYNKLESGEVAPVKDDAATSAADLTTEIVSVEIIG